MKQNVEDTPPPFAEFGTVHRFETYTQINEKAKLNATAEVALPIMVNIMLSTSVELHKLKMHLYTKPMKHNSLVTQCTAADMSTHIFFW